MVRFPSIKKNQDFQQVYRNGKSIANHTLVMYVYETGEEQNRLGVSCSKKIGNSVVRHTVTRRIREIFRISHHRMIRGLDIVVVVRKGAGDLSYRHLEKAYLDLCVKHHLLSEPVQKT